MRRNSLHPFCILKTRPFRSFTTLLSLFLGTILIGTLAGCSESLPENPPETVSSVDLKAYAGFWYELARLPVSFQRDEELATATYTLNEEGTVDLVNTAIRPDGTRRSVTGTAVPVTGSENARLKVTIDNIFARIFGSPPSHGNYWILKLEPDYSVALVGSPDRETLWLLAREPELPGPVFNRFLDHAREAGFAVDNLIVNNGAFPEEAVDDS
ncbi:MAG: lipocalin family protein [Oceanipulchritudo sp.]